MTPLPLLLLFMAVPLSLAKDPCAKDKTCIPTRQDYNLNADPENTLAPLGEKHWVKCRGQYALCAFANCTVLPNTDPPLAECGCFHPSKRSWYVTPRQLKSQALYNLTSDFCFQGDAMANNNTGCTKKNSAPVCTGIRKNWIYSGNYDLISTFTPTKEMDSTRCTGPGTMAECMSAACYKKEAFDGSPITCYCLMVNVPAGQQYGLGYKRSGSPVSCQQPDGYTISGEYIEQE